VNNISSGGLAILVVGALWFLVLLPSFISGDRSKGVANTEKISVRETVDAKLGERAAAAIRAKRARNISLTVAVVGLLIASLSWFDFASTGQSLVMASIASVIALTFAGLSIRHGKNFRNLAQGAVKRDLPIKLTNSKITLESEEATNTFKPSDVPNQNFLRTGAIEVVELAEVISLDEAKPQSGIDNIDEILRRRRHIG